MSSTTTAAEGLAVPGRLARLGGIVGSLVLHALLAALLLWSPPASPPLPPETMVVEMVLAPEPPPTPAPPPTAALEPPPPLPIVPLSPPPPQLTEAPLAARSSPPPAPLPAPPRERPVARAPQPSDRAAPSVSLPRPSALPVPPSTPLDAGRFEPGGGAPRSLASQSVQDFILAQIARHWLIDVHGDRYRNIVLYGTFVLLPNGMLAPPFGKNDPWNPRSMIGNYDRYQGPAGEAIRSALETFLLAVRQAQPFRLPPDGKADEARTLPLRFRLGDLPG